MVASHTNTPLLVTLCLGHFTGFSRYLSFLMGCTDSVSHCLCDSGAEEDRTAETLTFSFPLISTLFCSTLIFEVAQLNVWCVVNILHCKPQNLEVWGFAGSRGGEAVGWIKQSRRSSSSAASRSPAHVATVVKLQWHPSWNTGKWWRKQETGVCRKRSERADGPWRSCEICSSTLQAIYQWNCRFLTNKNHFLQRWQHNGLFQAMVNPLLWQVSSMCLIVPVLAVWVCLLSPEGSPHDKWRCL